MGIRVPPLEATAPSPGGSTATEPQPSRYGWAFWRERWFTVDARTLGLFRIGYGLLLLTNLWDRAGGFDGISFFTNEGLLPNHYALFRPPAQGIWGLLFGFSTPGEVHVALACIAVVYLLYTVGLFTKVMQVLALICLESLNWRFLLIQHGGNVTTNLLAVWTVFLPLGERFSVDAVIRSLRTHRQADAESLDQRAWRQQLKPTFASLAFFGVCFDWAFIYFFNAVHKQGAPWHDGTAVHYVLWQNRMSTHLDAWLRMHEPFWLSPMMTWGTLVMEWGLFVLILSPVFQKWGRRIAFGFIWALHGSIALLCTLGPFSYSMMTFALLLVTKDDWALLAAKLPRLSLQRRVRYDPKRPLHALAARVLARLDALDQLRFFENEGPFDVSHHGEPGATGLAAVASAAQALPLGPAWAWLFKVPLVAELLYGLLRLTARFWLETPELTKVEKPEGVLHRRLRLSVQLLVPALILTAVISQLLMENWGVPPSLKVTSRPQLLTDVINYLQIPQGWSMFAPDPPRDDERLVVDAVLADGSHVDPLTGEPPDFDAPLHGPYYMNQHWCEVHARMPRWPEHWRNFKDYLMRIPQLKGWPPEKRIVSLEVWKVTAMVPPPGSTTPYDLKRERLFDQNI